MYKTHSLITAHDVKHYWGYLMTMKYGFLIKNNKIKFYFNLIQRLIIRKSTNHRERVELQVKTFICTCNFITNKLFSSIYRISNT